MAPMSFPLRRFWIVAALGLSIFEPACNLNATSPTAGSPDGLSCGQRLVGGWIVTGFTPDQPLSPQAAQSLQALHQSLRITFDGQRAITTAPGLHHVGPYRIDNDGALDCVVSAPDDSGAVGSTLVHFTDANHYQVTERNSAVPGRSTMERSNPVY